MRNMRSKRATLTSPTIPRKKIKNNVKEIDTNQCFTFIYNMYRIRCQWRYSDDFCKNLISVSELKIAQEYMLGG